MYILDFVPTIIKIDQQDMPLFGQERKLGKDIHSKSEKKSFQSLLFSLKICGKSQNCRF